MRKLILLAWISLCGWSAVVNAQRNMENLGRGIVAVRTGTSSAFISWRLLGLDPSGIGFNVYRSTAGATAVKLNSSVLTAGTNYTDASADLTQANAYFVKPVISGTEQAASGSYTLTANSTTEPCFVIPLKTPATGYYTKYVWVGDLDGDGEYDYIIDRLAPFDSTNNDIGLGNQSIEAYKRDGTFLWKVDLGSTSTNTYNIAPGAATISMGNFDGVTVFDMDGDGKAEVLLKTANGVTFGDGSKLTASDNITQYISVLNGMTGAERARIQIPNDYIARGQMGAMFAIAHLNGTTPSLVAKMKNRNADKSFNEMICAWDFNGVNLSLKWKWLRGSSEGSYPDGHQLRIADVDGDGKDEVCEIGFCLNGDGTVRYSLAGQGIVHGDRFYIGKLDPSRSGLQGYGIQQDNASGLLEYYYDANTGTVLWKHSSSSIVDVGRGIIGDIDPRYAGSEVWSFSGLYNGPTNTQITTSATPYPCQSIWWDDDLLNDNVTTGKVEKWDYINSVTSRLLTNYKFEGAINSTDNPLFMGDILGDWRTELIYPTADFSKLVVFTTNIPTSNRIYTLAQNPQYRNQMTIKGYMESPFPDYFLGYAMTTPPTPNIRYVGSGTSTSAYEGENYTSMSGVTVLSTYSGYSGTGFADYGGNGTYIEWNNVWCQVAGTSTLVIRYSNGSSTDRQCAVTVNGTSVGNSAFSTTSGWGRWSTVTLTVNLKAGYNTVRITANTSNGGPNIDKMDVTSLKNGAVEENEPTSVSLVQSAFDIYPNPAQTDNVTFSFVLNNRSSVKVGIKDIMGKTILEKELGVFGAGKSELPFNLSLINKGIYIVYIKTAEGLFSQKLIKL